MPWAPAARFGGTAPLSIDVDVDPRPLRSSIEVVPVLGRNLTSSKRKGRLPHWERMMGYIDGFVVAVPTANLEAFKAHVAAAAPVICDHGALRVVECWGDDVPRGKLTDMYLAVKAEPQETVCFSWIEWPSKEVRDAGMAKVMADPRLQPDVNPMPFDGKRMIYGGFVPVIDRKE